MDYTYTYTSSGFDNSSVDAASSAVGTIAIFSGLMLVFMIIVCVIAYAVSSFLLGRIFKKAGVKQSIAWIPIYNTWKLLELGDQKGYWAPLMLVPGVNIASIIFTYIAMHHIGKKLGKEDWFIILAILVPFIWYIILGFDKSQWNGGNSSQMTNNINTAPAYAAPVNQQPIQQPPVQPTPQQPTEQSQQQTDQTPNNQQY